MSESKKITLEEIRLLERIEKKTKSSVPHKYIVLPINRKFIGMTKKERKEYEKNLDMVKQKNGS